VKAATPAGPICSERAAETNRAQRATTTALRRTLVIGA
jgi:hypothetical protein